MEDQMRNFQPDAASTMIDMEVETLLAYSESMELEYFQTLETSLDFCHGLPGVLRYKRESQERIYSPQLQPQRDSPICCEFCGLRAWPPLDPFYADTQETFCCEKYKELFEIVVHEKQLAVERSEGRTGGTAQSDNLFTNDTEERVKMHEREEYRQQREMEKFYREAHSNLLSAENNVVHSKTISFQLSKCAPREVTWKVKEVMPQEMKQWPDVEPAQYTLDFGFGLTHPQNNSSFFERHYSNGDKFLTVFPDGSAQIFYPSGKLAVIILSSERERICIIHDDTVNPLCPVRALFQSDGRATCYHGNGSIWLSMDTWGGRSLDERGAKIRTWSWTDHAQTPTPLRPIFLSLNKTIGVRVLGRQLVFVSFLASGQQARFKVGSCISPTQHNTPPRPIISKEELVLLACRVGLHMALIRLQQCQAFPSSPTHLQMRPPPFLHSLVQRLLRLSHRVQMDEPDKTFIHRCLQACP